MNLPQKVIIQQEKEMLEIFTGIETKNRYSVNSETGEQLLYAYEESNTAARIFLKKRRPLRLKVINKQKEELFTLDRTFHFWFPDHTVITPNGIIGRISRKFGFVNKYFDIILNNDRIVKCVSKFPHIWTYNITKDGHQIAQILRKWSGLGREIFTDADTFQIDFGTADKELKRLILATAFAIDLNVFEQNHRR